MDEPQPKPEVNPVTIYLAGPALDYTGDYHNPSAQEWRESISKDLPPNVLLFSPAHAFFGASKVTAPALDNIERHVIAACDAVLVNLTEGHPAFGSIRDIEFAKRMGKQVAVAGEIHSLMSHDLIVKDTIDAAFEALLFAVADVRNMPHTIFGLPILHMMRGNEDE